MLLPRLQHAWHTFPEVRESMPVAPQEQAQLLFFDTLVYDRLALHYLVERFGATRLMVGTD